MFDTRLKRYGLHRFQRLVCQKDDALRIAIVGSYVHRVGLAHLCLDCFNNGEGTEVVEFIHPIQRGHLIEMPVIEPQHSVLGDREGDAEAWADHVVRG